MYDPACARKPGRVEVAISRIHARAILVEMGAVAKTLLVVVARGRIKAVIVIRERAGGGTFTF